MENCNVNAPLHEIMLFYSQKRLMENCNVNAPLQEIMLFYS